MKKLVLIFVTISLLSISSAISQVTPSFGFDNDFRLPEHNEFIQIVGADAEGFYALRQNTETDNMYLEFYNGSSKNLESSNQLTLPMMGNIQAEFVDMFYLDRKLILFTQVLNNTAREKSLYIQHVNRSGEIIDEPQEIGRLANQNIEADFNVELTPNQQNMFVYYESVFTTYDNQPFFYKVFDPNLKEVYSHTIRLPLEERSFEMLQTTITNNGRLLLLAKVRPDERRAQRMRQIVYDYEFLIFDPTSETIEEYSVSANRYELQNVIFGFDGDRHVDFYGFMARRNRTDYEGIFHERLNIETMEMDRRGGRDAYWVFERAEAPIFRSERLLRIREQQYNYELIDVLHLSNGGSVVIAEHRNHWVDSTVVPQTREVIYRDYYKYNDILIGYTAPSNEMEWMTRIPKDQWSVNDDGRYSSFAYGVDGEKIFFFYNENRRNVSNLESQNLNGEDYRQLRQPDRNGRAVFVSVFSDGQVQGGELFPSNSRNFIVPELVQNFNDKYYAYTQRRARYKFASFSVY